MSGHERVGSQRESGDGGPTELVHQRTDVTASVSVSEASERKMEDKDHSAQVTEEYRRWYPGVIGVTNGCEPRRSFDKGPMG